MKNSFIQRKLRANQLIKTEKQNYLVIKTSVILIQRKFKQFIELNDRKYIRLELKLIIVLLTLVSIKTYLMYNFV